MFKAMLLVTVALVVCVQLSSAGICSQATKDSCVSDGCACVRKAKPEVPASLSCQDVWDAYSVFKCRRAWMKCMQDSGCMKEVN